MQELPLPGVASGSVVQTAFVVEDIERAMHQWVHAFNVGPFFYVPHFPVVDAIYAGNPVSVDIDVALAFSGSMCIELVSVNGSGPSPYRNGLPGQAHHYGRSTHHFEADVREHQRRGYVLAASAKVAVGGRVAYFDTGSPGPMLELMELTPEAEGFFSMIRAAAQTWDGQDPVRKLGP